MIHNKHTAKTMIVKDLKCFWYIGTFVVRTTVYKSAL